MIKDAWKNERCRQHYIKNRLKIQAKARAQWNADKPRHQAGCRRRNQAARWKAINGLGAKCACCFETCLSMLDIDHVKNDGNLYRIRERSRGTYAICRDVINSGFDKTKYQILCRSCNWSKWKNDGVCEHVIVKHAAIALGA